MFQHYSEQAPLYALIPKAPAYRGERYQMHIPPAPAGEHETNLQFMNERDEPVWTNHTRPQQMQVLSDPDRPLPEIADSEARAAVHGMRDYMHYQGIRSDDHAAKQAHLSKILSVPTEPNSAGDRIKSAHLLSALYSHPVSHNELRNAITKGGNLTVNAAMRHVDDMGHNERKQVVTPDVVDHLMRNPDPLIRVHGAKHIYSRDALHQALRDPDPHVAMHAIPHFGPRRTAMSPDHVETALEHPSPQVQLSAIKWALDSMGDNEDRTKWSARSRQNMDIDRLLTKAITTGSEEVREHLARNHPQTLTDDHVSQILQHSEPEYTRELTGWSGGKMVTRQETRPGLITVMHEPFFNRYGTERLGAFKKRVTPEMMQTAHESNPERLAKISEINKARFGGSTKEWNRTSS